MSDAAPDLDLRLKIAQIDRELAQHGQLRAHETQLNTHAERLRQEIRLAPWALVTASMGTGAALFAAAFAFAKLFQ